MAPCESHLDQGQSLRDVDDKRSTEFGNPDCSELRRDEGGNDNDLHCTQKGFAQAERELPTGSVNQIDPKVTDFSECVLVYCNKRKLCLRKLGRKGKVNKKWNQAAER